MWRIFVPQQQYFATWMASGGSGFAAIWAFAADTQIAAIAAGIAAVIGPITVGIERIYRARHETNTAKLVASQARIAELEAGAIRAAQASQQAVKSHTELMERVNDLIEQVATLMKQIQILQANQKAA